MISRAKNPFRSPLSMPVIQLGTIALGLHSPVHSIRAMTSGPPPPASRRGTSAQGPPAALARALPLRLISPAPPPRFPPWMERRILPCPGTPALPPCSSLGQGSSTQTQWSLTCSALSRSVAKARIIRNGSPLGMRVLFPISKPVNSEGGMLCVLQSNEAPKGRMRIMNNGGEGPRDRQIWISKIE